MNKYLLMFAIIGYTNTMSASLTADEKTELLTTSKKCAKDAQFFIQNIARSSLSYSYFNEEPKETLIEMCLHSCCMKSKSIRRDYHELETTRLNAAQKLMDISFKSAALVQAFKEIER